MSKPKTTSHTLTNTEAHELAGALQDMWHYAARITGDHDSAFEDRRGLRGVLSAYDSLCARAAVWVRPETPLFEHLGLDESDRVETMEGLIAEARRAVKAIEDTAKEYGIDPRSGNFLTPFATH